LCLPRPWHRGPQLVLRHLVRVRGRVHFQIRVRVRVGVQFSSAAFASSQRFRAPKNVALPAAASATASSVAVKLVGDLVRARVWVVPATAMASRPAACPPPPG
jgi:hypothetical protein